MQFPSTNKFAFFDFEVELTNLYRAGGIYADGDYNKISLHQHPGYRDFDTNTAQRHPGFQLDKTSGLGLTIIDPSKTVNFQSYIKYTLLAKSADAERTMCFLDGTDYGNKVAYVSYSRSGNTFFRKLLEQVTGIFTGSDNSLDIGLAYQLQHSGFTGEGIYDNHVWFVKSHYPIGKDEFFLANKAICCVRNPLDIVASMFNFWITQTQNKSIDDDDFHKTYHEDWTRMVK